MAKAVGYIPHEGPIVTRAEAKAAGERLFFTGKKCRRRGHLAQRYVAQGLCVECNREANERRPHGTIKPRATAKAAGEKRYYTGRPCPRGHLAERYTSTGLCVICLRSHNSTWKRLHPEWRSDKTREYARAYYAAMSEEQREQKRVLVRSRRAKKRGNGGNHTAAQIRDLLVRQRHKCPFCPANLRRGYHADHIMPVSRGGSNDISNIQLLCRRCNEKKSFIHPIDWAQRNGRLL